MNEAAREQVAAAYGLDQRAANFLSGETMEELEASATAFVQLLSTHAEQRDSSVARPDLFADAATKARRKREPTALFAGRPAQPRDQAGRFASTAGGGGFDEGARGQPLPPPRESHEQWLVRTIRARSADRGAAF